MRKRHRHRPMCRREMGSLTPVFGGRLSDDELSDRDGASEESCENEGEHRGRVKNTEGS